jgi:hypothetical protein
LDDDLAKGMLWHNFSSRSPAIKTAATECNHWRSCDG